MTTLEAALSLYQAGYSLIPIHADGSKKPAIAWSPYMEERVTEKNLRRWFDKPTPPGIGIVHGRVSGFSEVIDIDDSDVATEFLNMIREYLPDVAETIAQVHTPSGGIHLYFRSAQSATWGNQKLAQRIDPTDPAKRKTLIETRGEGGYTVAPGSPFSTHPSGEPYTADMEKLCNAPALSDETISVLYALAKSLDELPAASGDPRQDAHSAQDSPGNDYNSRATNDSIASLLERHGWEQIRERANGIIELRRPGKTLGLSATVGAVGVGCLYVFSSNAAPFTPERKYGPFSTYSHLDHGGDFAAAARQLGAEGYGHQYDKDSRNRNQETEQSAGEKATIAPKPTTKEKELAADEIIAYAIGTDTRPGNYCFSHWNKVSYATTNAQPALTMEVKSEEFSDRLQNAYRAKRNRACPTNALKTAISAISAHASSCTRRKVYIRKAHINGNIYIDLGNESGRVIEVTPEGWNIVDSSPALFIRVEGMLALPEPERGGKIEDLRKLVNLPAPATLDSNEVDQFLLAVAWLLAALGPHQPYPLLGVSGEQGSAKSNLTRMFKALTDPAIAGLTTLPSKIEQLIPLLSQSHTLAFDNVSGVPLEISDAIAAVSTGTGIRRRALYHDNKLIVLEMMLPIILNGIGDLIGREDLRDRAIMLHLPVIPEPRRMTERVIKAEFERLQGKILGALLDAIATGLKNLPTTKLESAPRMADFAAWIVACEPALPWPPGTFMAMYSGNRQTAAQAAIEGDKIGALMMEIIAEGTGDAGFGTGRKGYWKGPVRKMMEDIKGRIKSSGDSHHEVPGSTRAMSNKIERMAATLRLIGYQANFTRPGNVKTWEFIAPKTTTDSDPETPDANLMQGSWEAPQPIPEKSVGKKTTRIPAPPSGAQTPTDDTVPSIEDLGMDDPFAE